MVGHLMRRRSVCDPGQNADQVCEIKKPPLAGIGIGVVSYGLWQLRELGHAA